MPIFENRFEIDSEQKKISDFLFEYIDFESVDDIPRWKKIETCHMLFNIAYTNGQYVNNMWGIIFSCLSYLYQLTGFADKKIDFHNLPAGMEFLNEKDVEVYNEMAEELAEEFDLGMFDILFIESYSLEGRAILDFFSGLTTVSLSEIKNENLDFSIRTFSLQKVVIVANANIDKRNRLEWSKFWKIMSKFIDDFLLYLGNKDIAEFSVNSLKQV